MKLTVKQLLQKKPYLTEASLRWLLFHRQQNGLNVAVVRIGRRVLIDEDLYDWWENTHFEGTAQ